MVEAGFDIAGEHLVGPVDLELAVGRGGAVNNVKRGLEIEAEALRERKRLGIELAQDDGEVVVDQFRAGARTALTAIMDCRAHRFQQRLDLFEVVTLTADHEQALAAFGVPGKPPDRRVDGTEPARLRLLMQPVGHLRFDGRKIQHQRTGLRMIEQAARTHHHLIDLAARRKHGHDNGTLARDVRSRLRRAGAQRHQVFNRLGPDVTT